jgi:predicted nucleic acid-binding Zn ribbon protein
MHRRCGLCGSPFGLIRYEWWGERCCSEKCREQFLERMAEDRKRFAKWLISSQSVRIVGVRYQWVTKNRTEEIFVELGTFAFDRGTLRMYIMSELCQEEQLILERLMDGHGLDQVLMALSEICGLKSEQVSDATYGPSHPGPTG